MNRIIIISLALLLAIPTLNAQTWQDKVKAMEERVQEKLSQQRQKVELQFANQMRRVWVEAEFVEGERRPDLPKPLDPAIFDPATMPGEEQEAELIIVPAPEVAPDDRQEESVEIPYDEPPMRAEVPKSTTVPGEAGTSELLENRMASLDREMSTSFFGRQLDLRFDHRMAIEPMPYFTESRIADAWLQLDASNYELLIYQLQRHRRQMQLNDWGYALLINRAARQLFPRDKNSRTLFNWFMLAKSGYQSTVCFSRNRLYLMMPSNHRLYGQSYLNGKDGSKYYAIDLDGGTPELSMCRVFNGKHPEASRRLSFKVDQAPRLASRSVERSLRFSYQGKTYRIPFEVNQNVINFYRTMPFLDLDVYLQAPLSAEAHHSLLRALKPHIQDMSEKEAANFLLRFVQTAFGYKTDMQQFGRERYLFAEETLYYPYSDCEDRSVLFAYLTRQLLGLDVVGLIFPGHAATAVRFSDSDPGGDYITWRGKKYLICDPTYVNASCGMALPEVKNKKAKVVHF